MRSSDIKTGVRIGSLTVGNKTIKALSSGRRMPAWSLKCDCGTTIVAMTVNLTKGKHRSCGCKKREFTCETRGFEGDTKRPEYHVYRQMRDRCYLPTAPNYAWYGAKGVTVCDRWRFGEGGRTGFQCFLQDMGERPSGLTLERDDPRKPYGPSNCRWASWKEQASNKREHYMPAEERARLRQARGAARRVVSPQMREEILRRLSAGESQWPVARSFGISQTTVSAIKLGRR